MGDSNIGVEYREDAINTINRIYAEELNRLTWHDRHQNRNGVSGDTLSEYERENYDFGILDELVNGANPNTKNKEIFPHKDTPNGKFINHGRVFNFK